jgi:hypothetical protein
MVAFKGNCMLYYVESEENECPKVRNKSSRDKTRGFDGIFKADL